MAVVNLELPLLILIAGIVLALAAWLLATFTQFLRGRRYRVSLGLIAFPLSGLMGFVSILNAVSVFGDWLAGKPISFVLTLACLGYVVFGFLGCWTAVRLGGRLDRKHTLSVLYNLVKEHKNRNDH
jgi:predicted permease